MKTILKNRLRHFAKRYASKMNERAACYSVKQQKIALIVFCLLFSIISISILIETFSKNNHTDKVFVLRMHPPSNIGKSFSSPAPFITKETYDRIEEFKSKIDSNVLKARPHLLDSIKLFEQLYHSQTKK